MILFLRAVVNYAIRRTKYGMYDQWMGETKDVFQLKVPILYRKGVRKPKGPSFYFELEGAYTKGNLVQQGSDVDLVFQYRPTPATALARLRGKALSEAASQDRDVEIAVISRGFEFRDGIWFQVAKFRSGNLVEPVRFRLKAAEQVVEKSGVHITFSLNGCVLYGFNIPIQLVANLDQLPPGVFMHPPIELDLDELAAAPLPEKRDVRLVFHAEGSTIKVSVHGPFGDLHLPLEKIDRAGWSKLLQQANASVKKIAEDVDDLDRCLKLFLTAGSDLYDGLSQDRNFKFLLEQIDALPAETKITVQSDCGFLPWEILYPKRYNIDWENEVTQPQVLWGYRFLFENLLLPEETPGKYPVAGPQHGELFVSLNLNRAIDSEIARDNPPFLPVEAHEAFAAEALKEVKLEVQTRKDEIRRVLQEPHAATLVYFYCHGKTDWWHDPEPLEELDLAEEYTVQPGAVDERQYYPHSPLVFLNSCSSGVVTPLSFTTFLSKFRQKGAAGLIAASFPVPILFAATFGQELIKRYVEGTKPIGKVLLELRRALLNQGNPFGMFYSLQCPLHLSAPLKVEEAA